MNVRSKSDHTASQINFKVNVVSFLASDSVAVKMYVPIGYLEYVQCHNVRNRETGNMYYV